MRWNVVTMLQVSAVALLAGAPARTVELHASELWGGSDHAIVASDECHGDCERICECESQSRYSVYANMLWLGRNQVDPQVLIVAPANTQTLSVLDASELVFNVEAGIEMGGRLARSNGHAWEVRYFGIFDQLAHERRIYADGDLDNTNDATIVHFNAVLGSYTDLTTAYSSDLHSGELNVWIDEWWGFEPVAGFRWFRQNEDLETFVTTNLTEGALVETANNLYGGQVGLRRTLWETPNRLRVAATAKVGLYYNDLDFDSEVRTGGGVFPTFGESFGSTALGGELAVTATYRCSRNLAFNIGYTGLWLDGVGLAANQQDNFDVFAGTGNIDLSTLIYQGGHFGLELAW